MSERSWDEQLAFPPEAVADPADGSKDHLMRSVGPRCVMESRA